MRLILGIVTTLALVLLVTQLGFVQAVPEAPVRVASLKGPTSMGMAKLIHDNEGGERYQFTISGTADEIAPALAKGELDVALIPCNLATVLYNRLDGMIVMRAINTLGVLYIVEDGNSVQSISDLAGRTLFSTGRGTTPEYALNYVLRGNGIDPENGLDIEYKSESTEVAAALDSGQSKLAMLPQPFAQATLMQNPNLRVALSLTDEWDKIGGGSALVTGVVVMRKAFMDERPEAAQAFMDEYRASTEYVNDNPREAAPWIEQLGIAKAQVAELAIPLCNIVCITGTEMKEKASGYLAALYAEEPQSVGGQLPDEAFYEIQG